MFIGSNKDLEIIKNCNDANLKAYASDNIHTVSLDVTYHDGRRSFKVSGFEDGVWYWIITKNGSCQARTKRPNNTGMPDNLKSGIESLSGFSLDNVRVNHNSSRPAQLQAHAFAQGSDISLATGQATHLPHEAWHVVQQKHGRINPAMQL